jgi:hypothetical protein
VKHPSMAPAEAIYAATGWTREGRPAKCHVCSKISDDPALETGRGQICARCAIQTIAQSVSRGWEPEGKRENSLTSVAPVLRLKALARLVPLRIYGHWRCEQPRSSWEVIQNLGFDDSSPLARLVRLMAQEACTANLETTLERLKKLPPDASTLLKLGALQVAAAGGLKSPKQVAFVVRMAEDTVQEVRLSALRILGENQIHSVETAREILRLAPLVAMFETSYSADELKAAWRIALGPPGRPGDIPTSSRPGATAPVKKSGAKHIIARELALFFGDPQGVRDLLARLAPGPVKVYTLLAWQRRPMQAAEILELTGVQVGTNSGSSASQWPRSMALLPDLRLCKVESQYGYSSDCRLELPPFLAHLFRSSLPHPPGYHLQALPDPPKTQYEFENKDRILIDLRILTAFIEQGGAEYGKAGRLKASSLTAAAKACDLPELYPEAGDDAHKHAYVRLLVTFLMSTEWPQERSRPEVFLRDLVRNFLAIRGGSRSWPYWSFFSPYLFHLTGTERKIEKDHITATAGTLGRFLAELPAGAWIAYRNIMDFVTFRGLAVLPVSSEVELGTTLAGRYGPFRTYTCHNYAGLVVEPFLKTMMFLFGCLGLADLRFGPPRNERCQTPQGPYLTEYDGLSAVRLTPLGSFVTGRTLEYESEAGRLEQRRVQLDPRRLLLTLSGADPVLQMMLERTAEKVGAGVFRINARTFLKDCKKVEDVGRKVKVLREALPADLPPVWQEFFTSILGKVNPLQPAAYKMYQLSPDPELVRILATDPAISRLVLKAENRHIAISGKDLKQVVKRLREHGYFISTAAEEAKADRDD